MLLGSPHWSKAPMRVNFEKASVTTVPVHLVKNALVVGSVEAVVAIEQQGEGDTEKDRGDRHDPAVLPQTIEHRQHRDHQR